VADALVDRKQLLLEVGNELEVVLQLLGDGGHGFLLRLGIDSFQHFTYLVGARLFVELGAQLVY